MTTCLGKSCSFGLLRVPFVNCCQFMYLVISLLVLRARCGIWLYQFLIIAYRFIPSNRSSEFVVQKICSSNFDIVTETFCSRVKVSKHYDTFLQMTAFHFLSHYKGIQRHIPNFLVEYKLCHIVCHLFLSVVSKLRTTELILNQSLRFLRNCVGISCSLMLDHLICVWKYVVYF